MKEEIFTISKTRLVRIQSRLKGMFAEMVVKAHFQENKKAFVCKAIYYKDFIRLIELRLHSENPSINNTAEEYFKALMSTYFFKKHPENIKKLHGVLLKLKDLPDFLVIESDREDKDGKPKYTKPIFVEVKSGSSEPTQSQRQRAVNIFKELDMETYLCKVPDTNPSEMKCKFSNFRYLYPDDLFNDICTS